ncbi:carbamoyl phosphate synthase small subunit [Ruminococcaceae bacterium OttesenSCG-928-I18]|nr:carbamoyl phosphate synthase small subunit [Ruminococcaceae bacterium OttesenSCG-928-I18]
MPNNKAYLILADETVYPGHAFGAETDTIGEVVFTTSMSGYQESLTDPGNIGTILCQTFPSAGNYGLNSLDSESSRVWPAGYVTREWCAHPSNFRSEVNLDLFLRDHGVPGLAGIDTRSLTRHLRQKGTLVGALVHTLPEDLRQFCAGLQKERPLRNAVRHVSRKEPTGFPAEGVRKHKVVLYDFGVKNSVIRQLCLRGCEVVAVPFDYPADKAAVLSPDGLLLSNGPGDAEELSALFGNIQKLTTFGLPLFGIDLGHQLLALALGAKSEKLPFGHHGENQPVTDLQRGRTYITSQGHSHSVLAESIRAGQVSHLNANDGSVEGIRYPALSAFSVQFHAEACAGPEDTLFLFDDFIQMMENR